MALPKALTDISVDNDYSMDEAAIIENLISSGQLSTQQVSDYFNLPEEDINRVLEKDFGYTPQQTALAGVVPDREYTTEDAKIVEDALRSGVVSTQDISNYYQVPIEDVDRVLTTDFDYTPQQTALARVAADSSYTAEDAQIVENALRSGVVNAQDVADYYKVPVSDVNRVLTTDFGYPRRS